MAKRFTIKDIERIQTKGNNWAKTPSLPFPEEKRKGRKKIDNGPKISTNDLTKNAIVYFKAKGYWCWRNNNVPVFDPTIGRFRKGSVTKGISDIIGYHRTTGIALFVEIKNKHTRDTERDEQTDFLDAARKAGCHVFIVRCMNDLI